MFKLFYFLPEIDAFASLRKCLLRNIKTVSIKLQLYYINIKFFLFIILRIWYYGLTCFGSNFF